MAPLLRCLTFPRYGIRLLCHQANNGPKKLLLTSFGDPLKGLSLEHDSASVLDAPQGDEIVVKVLASPINPADINTAQGVYPVKPSLPGVIGHEGVMEVLDTGPDVKEFKVGDHVIPADAGLGLWRTHLRVKEDDLLPVDKELDLAAAATLTVNPCTAYRLLADFASLQPGDWVLQNGATSGVGLMVSQLCRARGVHCCGVIRERSTPKATAETKDALASYGASLVLTESETRDRSATDVLRTAGGAKVTFNCVGGKQTMSLLRLMSPGSSLITYGAMAMAPISVPAGPLIFNDVALRGFWMTAWSRREHRSSKRREMLNDLSQLLKKGQIRPPPIEERSLEDFKEALTASQFGGSTSGALRVKQLFVMS